MVFHEIYGSYYRVIGEILKEAAAHTLDKGKMDRIIREKAFDESILNIPPKLGKGGWNLLTEDFRTTLKRKPQMPLTTIQKRWLKALLEDPRIRLFDPDPAGLEAVEPLFRPEDFCYFDRNTEGDPFEEEGYIQNFRLILEALESNRSLHVEYAAAKGQKQRFECYPAYLEYSPKDDRFRLICRRAGENGGIGRVLNAGRITACSLGRENPPAAEEDLRIKKHVTLEILDERNTLERVLTHFSHLEKETRKMGKKRYQLKLVYDAGDETEILIRILSFGPTVWVTDPEEFTDLIRKRLRRQMKGRVSS